MQIRDATVDDADAVALVHVRGWQWGYRGLLPSEYLNGLSAERRAEQWRSWLLEPGATRTRVAEGDDGACVGFAVSGPSRDPSADGDTGEVYAIYVEEDAAGTGQELVAFCRTAPPDLMVTDVKMPDLEKPVYLVRQKDDLAIQWEGEFRIEGEKHEGRAPLPRAGTVIADPFTFAVEPVK